jgi:hypothetical protein
MSLSEISNRTTTIATRNKATSDGGVDIFVEHITNGVDV